MPELPEIEVLVRHLRPALRGKIIRGVDARRAKVLSPTSPQKFKRALRGAKFTGLSRRGKYLLFRLRPPDNGEPFTVLGHLGMTGRMFLAAKGARLPKHAAMVFDLGDRKFIYEDPRCFGRMTLDLSPVEKLGPEPLSEDFPPEIFWESLKRSRQAIKVKLLDQTPGLAANQLILAQVKRLWHAIRGVLKEAIECGSTVPLNFGPDKTDGLFYFGRATGAPDYYGERLRVYDRAGKPCPRCRRPIRRITQAARSTFYCPHCQKTR